MFTLRFDLRAPASGAPATYLYGAANVEMDYRTEEYDRFAVNAQGAENLVDESLERNGMGFGHPLDFEPLLMTPGFMRHAFDWPERSHDTRSSP